MSQFSFNLRRAELLQALDEVDAQTWELAGPICRRVTDAWIWHEPNEGLSNRADFAEAALRRRDLDAAGACFRAVEYVEGQEGNETTRVVGLITVPAMGVVAPIHARGLWSGAPSLAPSHTSAFTRFPASCSYRRGLRLLASLHAFAAHPVYALVLFVGERSIPRLTLGFIRVPCRMVAHLHLSQTNQPNPRIPPGESPEGWSKTRSGKGNVGRPILMHGVVGPLLASVA